MMHVVLRAGHAHLLPNYLTVISLLCEKCVLYAYATGRREGIIFFENHLRIIIFIALFVIHRYEFWVVKKKINNALTS